MESLWNDLSALAKLQRERRAFAFFRLHLYGAAVQHHNLFAQTQANATAIFLGAEKGNKNFIQYFFGHATSIVGNFQHYFFIGRNASR